MLKPTSNFLSLDVTDHKKIPRTFQSDRYQLIDVFSYKEFIIIVNNLTLQSHTTQPLYVYDVHGDSGIRKQTHFGTLMAWVYHPSYQINYSKLNSRFSNLNINDPELREELQLLEDSTKCKEFINFASIQQIAYAF